MGICANCQGMVEDILCSDPALESGKILLRQFASLVNREVAKARDVPSTGQSVEDTLQKAQRLPSYC